MAISDWFARKCDIDVELRNMVAYLLSTCNAMGFMGFSAPFPIKCKMPTLRELFLNPDTQNITGPYILGIFDYLGQAKGLSEAVILATAKAGLKKGLSMSGSSASDLINAGVQASRSKPGRNIIKAGAMALAGFLEHEKPPFGQSFNEAFDFGLDPQESDVLFDENED